MSERGLVTAVLSFDASREDFVRSAIERLRNPAAATIRRRLTATRIIHFASLSVVHIQDATCMLLLELSADCSDDDAISCFVAALPEELAGIYQAASITIPAAWSICAVSRRTRYGHESSFVPGLVFDGSPDMSVVRIRRERVLALWIERRLQQLHGPLPLAAKLAQIRNELWRAGRFKWAFVAFPCPMLEPARIALTDWRRLIGTILLEMLVWPRPVVPATFGAAILSWVAGVAVWGLSASFRLFLLCAAFILKALIAALLIAAAVIAVLALMLRRKEKRDADPDAIPDAHRMERILETENVASQNILMTVSTMKPGRLRRLYLKLSFLTIRTLLPLAWAPGRLGDISDIHFARWILLPGSDALVFLSNYDGSWLTYLEDFVQRAPQGVSAIWSNTTGFPRTRWLVEEGAADGPRFLQWARVQTQPVSFWYSAYPDLSMTRIRLHARLARAIATGATDAELLGWLTSLGAASAATP